MDVPTTHVMIMNSYFDFIYAKAMYEHLGNTVKRMCQGCEVDHPSQKQHSCVMNDSQEHIEMYFETLLSAVNEDDILLSWSDTMNALTICPELLALQKLKIYDKDWLSSMKTDQWKAKIEKMILNITQLESRAFQPID